MSDPNSKDGSSPHPDEVSPSPTPDTPVDSASPSSPPTPAPASATTASESESTPASSSSSPSSVADAPSPPTLEQARVFLRNESVRNESPSRKAAFLASKGLTTEQINALLAEEGEQAAAAAAAADETTPSTPSTGSSVAPTESSSVPPIVTYPEFLARPPSAPRPPPLVTPDVLMRALYGGAAASALLYGAAKFVLAPMVSSLTDARCELHSTTADNLDQLLRRLESVVSVVPDAAKPGAAAAAAAAAATSASAAATGGEDEDSATTNDDDSYDDPTEVFHRDIGVQTSLPPSPKLTPANIGVDGAAASSSSSASPAPPPPPPPSAVQADRLSHLVDSVRSLGEAYSGGTGVSTLEEVRTLLDVFRTDVDQLARPPAYAFGSSYLNLSNSSSYYGSSDSTPATSRYVSTTRNEPDDEIRKAKENIRRVKGALLTARTFPAAR